MASSMASRPYGLDKTDNCKNEKHLWGHKHLFTSFFYYLTMLIKAVLTLPLLALTYAASSGDLLERADASH